MASTEQKALLRKNIFLRGGNSFGSSARYIFHVYKSYLNLFRSHLIAAEVGNLPIAGANPANETTYHFSNNGKSELFIPDEELHLMVRQMDGEIRPKWNRPYIQARVQYLVINRHPKP